MRYRFLQSLLGQFSLRALCRTLQVSISGYSAWCRRRRVGLPSRHRREETRLLVQIRAVHQESGKTYGSPCVHQELVDQGIRCSRKRIERLMRKYSIRAEQARRFVLTTDSAHALPVASNLLQRDFSAPVANRRWCSDITYIWTSEGWLYLSVVLDLFSRRIVGWNASSSLDRSLVIKALEGAIFSRRPSTGVICHSDRGSQYASSDYQELLRDQGIVCSMSRKGDCACKPACAGTTLRWKASSPA